MSALTSLRRKPDVLQEVAAHPQSPGMNLGGSCSEFTKCRPRRDFNHVLLERFQDPLRRVPVDEMVSMMKSSAPRGRPVGVVHLREARTIDANAEVPLRIDP